jgi:hypothetical protein
MKSPVPILLAAAGALLTACLVPPSMMQRASWSAPGDRLSEGRYRQAPGVTPTSVPEDPGARPQPVSTDPATEGLAQPTASQAPAETPLYGWDGGIVDGSPQGEVLSQAGDPRGLETPGGRMHIIELYQQVLDERDSLTEEVQLLRGALQETRTALDAETVRAGELETRVASLEAAHRELMEDNQSIAARLVTAQIRRLESEKLLLETRIAVEQEKALEAEQAATRLRGSGSPLRSSSEGH